MATLNPSDLLRRAFPTARRLLVEADLRRWCVDEYRSVLVIGAGHDPYRSYFKRADTYIALDIQKFPGVTHVVADGASLPFSEGVFDCVLVIEVMEHVPEPAKLVAAAYSVLGYGGKLLLSVPFAFHQHADPYDYWRPTMRALESMTACFKSVDVIPQGNRLLAISDLISTSFHPTPVLFPLRVINHFLVPLTRWLKTGRYSSAPSGFFVVATK